MTMLKVGRNFGVERADKVGAIRDNYRHFTLGYRHKSAFQL
jgi:hypothetical protein